MLTASTSFKGAGRGEYYLNLAREDYYLAGGEPPGKWCGSGAHALGLRGEVQPAHFRHLLDGFDAEGTRSLVQNAGKRDRQSAWDLTFSAPKSVSVFWAIASRGARERVQEAHQQAVEAALAYLEEVAGLTRRGHAGKSMEGARLIFATFEHGTSRDQDMQLHTHAILLNLGVRADGTTGTLWSKEIFNHKMAAGALYRAELACQMVRQVGVAVARDREYFRIVGVPSKLCVLFSKRSQEIRRVMAERGLTGAVAAKIVALDTRHVKHHVARETLLEWWREVGRAHGWKPTDAERLVRMEKRDLFPTIEESVGTRNVEAQREETQTVTPAAHGASKEVHPNPSVGQAVEDRQVPSPENEAKKLFQEIREKRRGFQHEREFVRAAAEEAQHRGLSAKDVLGAVRKYLPLEIRYQQLFPNAPRWSPAKKAVAPHLAFKTRGKRRREHPVILADKKFPGFRLQVVKERLFPDAPKCSPASRVKVPKIKIVPHRYTREERASLREAKQQARTRAQFFDRGDRIRLDADAPTLGLKRGQQGEILKVGRDSLVVRTDGARHPVHIPLAAYHQITVLERANVARERTTENRQGPQEARQNQDRKRQDADVRRKSEEERRRREEAERQRKEQERARQQQSQSQSQSQGR